MRGIIISDSHDNLTNLRKVLEWAQKEGMEFLIHCGDICQPETLKEIVEGFPGRIFVTLGNGDFEVERLLEFNSERVTVFEKEGEFEIDGKKVFISHYPEVVKNSGAKFNFGFHGHTHYPSAEFQDKEKMILNPGNLAGLRYPPTFAVWNTETKEINLKRVHELFLEGAGDI